MKFKQGKASSAPLFEVQLADVDPSQKEGVNDMESIRTFLTTPFSPKFLDQFPVHQRVPYKLNIFYELQPARLKNEKKKMNRTRKKK